MEKVIFCFLYFILFCIPFDLYHKYKYKFCKYSYKNKGFCKNWMCKKAATCYHSRVNWKAKQSYDFVFHVPELESEV